MSTDDLLNHLALTDVVEILEVSLHEDGKILSISCQSGELTIEGHQGIFMQALQKEFDKLNALSDEKIAFALP